MYKEGLEKQGKEIDDHHIANLFVRNPNAKKPYEGESRAGKSVWVDFLNESACDYWKDLFHPSVFKGTNYMYGVWNDMNEPSVYKSAKHQTQIGMPMDNTHMTADGDILQHRWIHNAYGALQQRATFQGLLRRDRGQQRPFLLSRSFFFGSQRFGAVAAGSNHAKHEDVELSINMLLSLGVSGIVNAGHDVPGYSGVPTDDLYVQWYQLGVYYPFFRANSEKGSEMREPWLQSPRIQRVILAAIKQRYAQAHYMYNLFFESSQTGLPIVRPMWYEYPLDELTYDLNHQFMFGPDILVSPKIGNPCVENAIAGASTEIQVYLPPTNQWYDIYSKLEVDSHDDIHVRRIADAEQGTFVRGGSILPVLNFPDSAESLMQAIEAPVRLEIYSDTMGEHPFASGHLYLDDGENHNNRHHERTQVRYEYDGKLITVTKSIGDENLYSKAATKIIDEVMIFGVDKAPKRVMNKFAMQANGQGDVDVQHVYVESTKMVHLWHLRIPVDEGLFNNHTVDLLELIF
jgi:alpha 1,3-glucosidase